MNVLQRYNFGELFNKIVLKMLFFSPQSVYVNTNEIQEKITCIWKLMNNKQVRQVTPLTFDNYRK